MAGDILAIVGGKGGVGKSIFAANLAATITTEMRSQVLLVDLDAKSCGDQNIITGLRPVKTISEFGQFSGSINQQTVGSLVARHAAGFAFLGAVRSPEESTATDPSMVSRTIEQMSQFFNFVVVDLGCDLGPAQYAVLERATAIFVVTVSEVLALNQTMKLINELSTAAVPGDLVQIVVNKMGPSSLSPQTITQSLRKQPLALIPQDDTTTAAALQRSTPFVLTQKNTPIASAYYDLVRRFTSTGLLQKLKTINRPSALKASSHAVSPGTDSRSNSPMHKAPEVVDPRTLLKMRAHQELIRAMDLKKGLTDTGGDPAKEAALRDKTKQSISQILDREKKDLGRDERGQLIKEILDEALGLGPLEDLLADEAVTEIMVNGKDTIFIEKSGRITKSVVTFTSNLQLRNVIERIVTPLGRRIDEKTPYVDARLKDGSRVHAIIEPLSIDGPAVTIRKFAKKPITWQNYVEWGSLTQSMVDFLRICVENGLNIVISGGTGSGKTTLLNVLSGFIPATERIITVEDAAELQLKQTHVVRLETRPANMEGEGAVTIRDLIRNTLRMRPDRIVVGECRGGEAMDMLQAMSTGHDGSMSTVHANNPREAIGRLQTLCMMAGQDLPERAIKEQISSAVDLIIQISRLSDGSRRVMSISEVIGMQGEQVTQQEVFRFKEEGFDKNRKITGQFQALGLVPTFIEEFERKGVKIPRTLFSQSEPVGQAGAAQPMKKAVGGKP